jgi:hypothetical protein
MIVFFAMFFGEFAEVWGGFFRRKGNLNNFAFAQTFSAYLKSV